MLSPAAVLAWIVLTLECRPDGGGVRLPLADLAARIGRAGTIDSGRRLGVDVRQLEDSGWLKSVRDPHGKRYWPQRMVDPRTPGSGWYATISRADLARIGQPLDSGSPDAGTMTESDLVAWTRWQGIVRCDRVRISWAQIARRLGVDDPDTAKSATRRLIRAGWLAMQATPGGAHTYWRADTAALAERELDDLEAGGTPPKTRHITPPKTRHITPPKTRHMHSYLSAPRSLPPSPPTEPAGSPARPAATEEGSTASETTTTDTDTDTDTEDAPVPSGPRPTPAAAADPTPAAAADPKAAAAERVCDAVASAWPTLVGRPAIHRGQLKAKLTATDAIARLGVELLIRHLTENQGAVRNPLSVVLARLDALPASPARHRPEPTWCGHCDDRVSRLALVGVDPAGADVWAPCEACGGGTPQRTARERAQACADRPPAAATGPQTTSPAPGGHSPGYLAARAAYREAAKTAPGPRTAGVSQPPRFVRSPEQTTRVGWRTGPRIGDDG